MPLNNYGRIRKTDLSRIMKIEIHKLSLLALSTLIICCTDLWADTAAASAQPLKTPVYTYPYVKSAQQPDYPKRSLREGREGWVVINYMVSADGQMFEPTVVASLGSKSFENAALKAINNSEFEPATLDGEPIEGSGYYKYNFSIFGGTTRARNKFVRPYKKFLRQIKNGQAEEARNSLAKLESRDAINLYEAAFLNFARYRMAKYDGDALAQLDHLLAATNYENRNQEMHYLPGEMVPPLRIEIFKLYVALQQYSEALQTYEIIVKSGDKKTQSALKPTVDQLIVLKSDDRGYRVSRQIDASEFWSIDLFKQAFYFENISGQLDELKLRCQKKYMFFSVSTDQQYNVPESWGQCSLQVQGTPDSTFDFVQLPASMSK